MTSPNNKDIPMTISKIPRYDGGNWRTFQFRNGSKLTLTSRGQELLKYNPDLRRVLHGYKDEATASNTKSSNEDELIRNFFRPGGNSRVYKVSDYELLVKEAKKGTRPSLEVALDSMDYLYGACLQYLAPYIRVPDHFGLFIAAETGVEYLLMQKINSGITVKDVIRGRVSVNEEIVKLVEEDFNGLKPKVLDAVQKVRQRFDIPFKNLLTDWTDENVLVDLTTQPRKKPYTLWIIDQ